MAFSNIADELQGLSLSDPEYLLFCPSGDKAWLREKFNDVPRYLFRVFTPKSCGVTDTSWTRSMDASYAPEKSRVDIFARQDNKQVASILNTHLRWREGLEDNFVSWTSSDGWVPADAWERSKMAHRDAFENWMLTARDAKRRGDNEMTEEKARKMWPFDER